MRPGSALGFHIVHRDCAGGGALAAITLGCVAGRLVGPDKEPMRAAVNSLWGWAQPALFGLLGAAVHFPDVYENEDVGIGLLLLAIALCARVRRAAP